MSLYERNKVSNLFVQSYVRFIINEKLLYFILEFQCYKFNDNLISAMRSSVA